MLLLEKSLTALLRKPGLWFVTVLVNQRIMTCFLWHLTVMVDLAHVLLALNVRALIPEPPGGAWWATRPLRALVLLLLTGVVLLVMGSVRGAAGRRQAGARAVETDSGHTCRERRARGPGLGGRGGGEPRELVVAAAIGGRDVLVRGGGRACAQKGTTHHEAVSTSVHRPTGISRPSSHAVCIG